MPTTGRTNRIPTTPSASHAAKIRISFPKYVPTTVIAAAMGNPSAIATRNARGVSIEWSDDDAVTGMRGRQRPAPGAARRLKQLLEERGDVGAAAVQHGADEPHAHPIERAPGALDVGDARA